MSSAMARIRARYWHARGCHAHARQWDEIAARLARAEQVANKVVVL